MRITKKTCVIWPLTGLISHTRLIVFLDLVLFYGTIFKTIVLFTATVYIRFLMQRIVLLIMKLYSYMYQYRTVIGE